MAETRQEKVDRILKVIPPYPAEVTSLNDAKLFQQVTNWSQEGLKKQWAAEQAEFNGKMANYHMGLTKVKPVLAKTTTCNAFVGWYGYQIGGKTNYGRFDMDKKFPAAWVAADSEGKKRPGYGDICRFTRFHVAVSLGFDGDTWHSVEGGQGGPATGYDVVKRKQTQYTSALLRGWLDISKIPGVELAESSGAGAGSAPWLLGWWAVTWRAKDFYYLFEQGGLVRFSRDRPRSNRDPLLKPIDVGVYTVTDNIRIQWTATRSVETLTRSDSDTQLSGFWNGKVPLQARKL